MDACKPPRAKHDDGQNFCTLMQESIRSSETVVMANLRSRSGEVTEGLVHREQGWRCGCPSWAVAVPCCLGGVSRPAGDCGARSDPEGAGEGG